LAVTILLVFTELFFMSAQLVVVKLIFHYQLTALICLLRSGLMVVVSQL